MKKLSEYKDGEALDIIADILEPIVMMTKNEKFMAAVNNKEIARVEKVRVALKECKPEITQILAVLNGLPVSEYHYSVASIMADIATLLSDTDFISFFEQQSQKTSDTTFGSATENTEVAVQ